MCDTDIVLYYSSLFILLSYYSVHSKLFFINCYFIIILVYFSIIWSNWFVFSHVSVHVFSEKVKDLKTESRKLKKSLKGECEWQHFFTFSISRLVTDWNAVRQKPLHHDFHQRLTAWVVQHVMFNVSGTVLSVIALSLAIIQPKV